jgi:hypothetical protein
VEQAVRSETILFKEILSLPEDDRATLRMQVSNGQVTFVSLNGEPILNEPCPLPSATNYTEYSSKAGFCGQLGEIEIHSFSAY